MTAESTMRKGPPALAIVVAAVVGGGALLLGGGLLLLLSRDNAMADKRQAAAVEAAAAARSYYASLEIPEFTLTTQSEEPFTRADLLGGYSVLDFMFSNCVTACPVMSGNLLRVYLETQDLPLRFVSISVDPVHDTPAQLREYAARLKVDTDRWRFLTGAPQQVQKLLEALDFETRSDDSSTIHLSGGRSMVNIIHPTRFVLIGPAGEVVGMYRGLDDAGVYELLAKIENLRQSGAFEQ